MRSPTLAFLLGFIISSLVAYAAPTIVLPPLRTADEGSLLTQRPTINFAGAGVTCVDDTTRTTCTIPGGAGSAYSTIQQSGTPLTQRSTMNFSGNITCADNGVDSRTDCVVPIYNAYDQWYDEGVALTQRTKIDFQGSGVTCADDGLSMTICTISGTGGSAYDTVQNEGSALTQRSTINFIGTAVNCVDNAGATRTDCSVDLSAAAPNDATYITQTSNATLTNEQALSSLATGPVKVTTGTGVLSSGSINLSSEVTGNLPVSNLNSGTGASSSTYWRGDGTWAAVSGYTLPAATSTVLGGVRGTGSGLTCTGTNKATGFDATGTLQCAADQTSAVANDAIQINGIADAFMWGNNVPVEGTVPSAAYPLTFLVWAKLHTVPSGGNYGGIWSIEDGNGHSTEYNELILNTNSNSLRVFDHVTGSIATLGTMTVGVWYKVGIRLESGTYSAFFQAEGTPGVVKTTGSIANVTAPHFMGLGSTLFRATEWFPGVLSHARVWTAALSDAEVAAEFTSDTAVRSTDLWSETLPSYVTVSTRLDAVAGQPLLQIVGGGGTAHTLVSGPTLDPATSVLFAADEGVKLTQRNTINFAGAGVSCVDDTTQTTCTIAGSSGAPTNATYITQTSNATLTNEQALSSLGTALVQNTTGTGVLTAYTGTSCTNQFPRSLSATGAATCASVALATDVTGTLAQARGGTGSGALTCSAGDFLTSNGTTYSCATPTVSAYATVYDEGTALTQRTRLNFIGSSVSCVDNGSNRTDCTFTAGGASPLTTKGDIYTFSTVDDKIAADPTDGLCLKTDSTKAVGLTWGTCAAAGGGLTFGEVQRLAFLAQ